MNSNSNEPNVEYVLTDDTVGPNTNIDQRQGSAKFTPMQELAFRLAMEKVANRVRINGARQAKLKKSRREKERIAKASRKRNR